MPTRQIESSARAACRQKYYERTGMIYCTSSGYPALRLRACLAQPPTVSAATVVQAELAAPPVNGYNALTPPPPGGASIALLS